MASSLASGLLRIKVESGRGEPQNSTLDICAWIYNAFRCHTCTHICALTHTCICMQNELNLRLLFLEAVPVPEQKRNTGVRLEY